MDEQHQPSAKPLFRKGTIDLIIAVSALFVSAVSLWIGVRTETANEQMVSASTWPFLQVTISNATTDAKPDLQFQVINAGVGPAKIESFEVFWKGKAYRSARQLLADCCGFRDVLATSPDARNHTPLMTGTVQGIVLRAGETETFVHYPLGSDNLAVWTKLDAAREQMTYRICYCSVLNQCYRSDLQSELYIRGQLHPEEVSSCPAPAVAYTK